MNLALASSGSGPLARVVVKPFDRENLSVRASIVQVTGAALGDRGISTGARLRTTHLIAVKNTGSLDYTAAVKDGNGLWSEWSAAVSASVANFSAGATEAGIGSGATDDLGIDEPSVVFPDLNQGSGLVTATRTIVSSGFLEEVRRSKWSKKRAAFNVKLIDLDSEQAELLHRFFRALGGPARPFWFTFTDPKTDEEQKYVVRFANPSMASQLFTVALHNVSLNLVEVASTGQVQHV